MASSGNFIPVLAWSSTVRRPYSLRPSRASLRRPLCYNLPAAPLPEERNPEYAVRLQGVLRKLNFPPDYVASVV
jgi:hypothetical protein